MLLFSSFSWWWWWWWSSSSPASQFVSLTLKLKDKLQPQRIRRSERIKHTPSQRVKPPDLKLNEHTLQHKVHTHTHTHTHTATVSAGLQTSLLQWCTVGKMLFGLQGDFSLQYRKWPLGDIGSQAERRHRIHVLSTLFWNAILCKTSGQALLVIGWLTHFSAQQKLTQQCFDTTTMTLRKSVIVKYAS